MSKVIEFANVSHAYGNKRVLHDINLSLDAGGPVALVGPNGAGKTTFFGLVCGYLGAQSGSIKVLGQQPGSEALFGQVSALPQDALLNPQQSIEKQLTLFARLQGMSAAQAKHDIDRVLSLVDLRDTLKAAPNELSHGMKKRISIAQSLLGSPKLVMLDEATAGLDPANARVIRTLVSEQSANTTFVLSSHDLAELERLCDRVLYLQMGKLQSRQMRDDNTQYGYFTLQLQQGDAKEVITQLGELPGVTSVTNSQPNEFVVQFDAKQGVKLDVAIIEACYKYHWRYRVLINGNTLENQLFD